MRALTKPYFVPTSLYLLSIFEPPTIPAVCPDGYDFTVQLVGPGFNPAKGCTVPLLQEEALSIRCFPSPAREVVRHSTLSFISNSECTFRLSLLTYFPFLEAVSSFKSFSANASFRCASFAFNLSTSTGAQSSSSSTIN